MSFRHDDYTIAWICALPLEMTAAKAMLDKVHPSLPQPETDHNVYTLGNISGHNVVVACLPSGVYGTTSAAIVLAHMLPTFPSLRFGLMVGIGGGVPGKVADIRLGDVVVSMPTAASGGVIQYDYGKTLRDGRLQRTGSLNPQYLLTAVSQIRSDYMVRDSLLKKGGIGKTQIALELAYRARQKVLGNSIFWIPCMSYESVEQAYLSIASSLEMTDIKPAEVKEQVKTFLSQEHAGKWLLIFDNADDVEMWTKGSATAPPLKDILPQSEHGHILFTSRNRKLAVKLASPNVLLIPEMDRSTAKEIFEKLLIQKDLLQDDCATTAVLKQLGFLLLVISQAAAYINENEISLSEYLLLLGEQERSTIEMLSKEFEDEGRYAEIQNPVATTWWISFLQIQQLDELAADYLSFMACINPRDIPQSILSPAASVKKQAEAIGLLKAYSFITAQMRIDKTVDIWAERAACQLDDVFPDDDHGNRKIWRDYLLHALYLTNSEQFQRCRHEYHDLSSRIGRCLQSDGRYNEAQIFFTDVLEIGETALGPEHPATLTSVSNLGSVLEGQGNVSNLVSVLERQGKYEEAEVMHRRDLKGSEEVLGPEHPDTLISVSNLGSALEQQGKYEEAEAMQRRALEGHEKTLGPEHPDTLTSANNLGSVLERQGKYEEAEVMHRRALQGYEKALGPEHPNTLTSVSNLGSVLERQGKYEEAEVMHRRALQGYEKALGPEHPNTLTSVSQPWFSA
ncbi:uncharacterized protein CDV56_100225 [Aspergillus thermomutatus]|uniref:NACHT domain-containing protein n=1 Tax=Aspergillus thermomutatus TaxID=41047 RepID=A0A397G1C7_ASPTH|nr:uncharacterized protein CDV56_100225 [Aspergillus thermomutatus]RHZ43106.1 hypothetical protein CDV56_100225 [Aspergillus thermomutatus]